MGCNVSCLPPDEGTIEREPDIEGPGVTLSFLLTTISALAVTSLVLCHDPFAMKESSMIRIRIFFFRISMSTLQRILLTLSDQQLVAGLALSIAMYISMPVLQVHHLVLAFHLAILSFSVHALMITTLRRRVYEARNKQRCRLRVFFMMLNALSLAPFVYHIPYLPPFKSKEFNSYPACCVFSGSLYDQTNTPGWILFGLCVLLLLVIISILLAFAFMGLFGQERKVLQAICILIVMFGVVATISGTLSMAVRHLRIFDGDRGGWGFGQVFAIGLLALALLNMLEMDSSERKTDEGVEMCP